MSPISIITWQPGAGRSGIEMRVLILGGEKIDDYSDEGFM